MFIEMKIIFSLWYLFQNIISVVSLTYTISHGKYLSGFVVDRSHYIGLQMCINDCKLRSYCLSINYNRMELICEYNSASKTGQVNDVRDQEWSYLVDIEKDTELSRCSENCREKASMCISSLLKTRPDHTCIPFSNVCVASSMKNARVSNSYLVVGGNVLHQCLPEYVGQNKTQSCMVGGVLSPVNPDIKCYKKFSIPGDSTSWALIFRAQKSLGISVYDTWYTTGISHETDSYVDASCEETVSSSNCSGHYRTSFIDNWLQFPIEKAGIAFFKDGTGLVKEVVFNATGTNNTNWFLPNRLLTSSWSTMTSTQSYIVFNILGPRAATVRSFDVTHVHNSCPNDKGYFITIDGTGVCNFDQHSTYPQFLYCASTDMCLFESEGVYADVMTIFISSDSLNNK